MIRIRTGYSFHHAFGNAKDIVTAAKTAGHEAIAVADRNSTFSFYELRALCKAANMKLVYGVDLGVSPDLSIKRPIIDRWSFYATDDLASVNRLVALATERAGEPCLSYEQALARHGCVTVCGPATDLHRVQKSRQRVFIPLSASLPFAVYKRAVALNIPFIMASDNLYPRESDADAYAVALGRRASLQSYPQHILTTPEWRDGCLRSGFVKTDIDKAQRNAKIILSDCSATLENAELFVPKKPKTLDAMCKEGAKRLKIDLKNKTYSERLTRELSIIKAKKFEDYFYIIADLIGYAKQHMIVGPARGSSAGSLVCYLLGITTVDPIKYDLIFERFIDVNRNDIPDIDIDFSDQKRELVFEYAEKKFGREHVARLGSVGMFKARSAIKAAADALSIPQIRVDQINEIMLQTFKGDSRANDAIADTLDTTDVGRKFDSDFPGVRVACQIEGTPHNASRHAAGIIITRRPIIETVAIDSRTGSAMCDKYAAESLNLLKIDALGLTQLSIFERCLSLAGLPQTTDYLSSIPLNDPQAFAVLNEGRFSGVFQFEGRVLQGMTKSVRITHLEDVVAITALSRPGPMSTGGAATWIERKNGKQKVTYPHKMFEPILSSTLGVIAYQEQVMRIAREVGSMTWEDVTALRRVMGRTLGREALDKFGDTWKKGAIRNGLPKQIVDSIWNDLCAYGSYAFNRSHAVAYGLVSYYSAYLKAHHPMAFAAATLDAQTEPRKQIEMLREMKKQGVGYVPVDKEKSSANWNYIDPQNKAAQEWNDDPPMLIGPLQAVKGIGKSMTKEIMDARENGEEIRPALAKKLANPKTNVDSLTPIYDRVSVLVPDMIKAGIVTEPTFIEDITDAHESSVLVIGLAERVKQKDENEPAKVKKRGRKLDGPHIALNVFLQDDTGEILCRVGRYEYDRLAPQIMEAGTPGKSIFAILGKTVQGFRMIKIERVKYLGDIE